MVQLRRLALAVLALTLLLSGSARAGIWTPLNSGTTDSISALSYQGDDKLFFATTSGKVLQFNGTAGSTSRLSAPGVVFNDIAFSPSGSTGIAVGTGNALYRSTNSGQTWAPVGGLQTYNDGGATTVATNCSHSAATPIAFNGDLGAVSFKDESTVYVTASSGARGAVFKSTNGGASFTDVGRTPTDCRVDAAITDVHAIAGSDSVYFVDQSFGQVWFSSNGLASPAAKKDDSVNCFDKLPRLAIDDADASKVFISDRCDGGLSYQFSSDAAVSFSRPDFPDGANPLGARDVAVRGGNALFVGQGGGIWQTNGLRAVARPADGGLATSQWNAVGMTSASNAVVAGDGGAVVRTTQANLPLDTSPPGGTISGPSSATAGVPTSYTANVSDDVGGTGIDPASFRWTGPGLATTAGNPVKIVFPAAGLYSLTVAFADLAGNVATASTTVSVGRATTTTPPSTGTFIAPGTKNPKPTTTSTLTGGGSVTLSGPKTCVAPGKTFSARLSFKRSTKKRAKAVKVTSVVFYIDGKAVKTDKKAPFTQRLSVKSYATSSKHTLKARAKIKVRHGKGPTKSISTSFQVCGS